MLVSIDKKLNTSPTGHGASVEFRSVSKIYNEFTALDNINLKVNAGEFLTLLGPSGSGKSTLLMLLAGFEKLSRGEVLVDGQSMVGIPANRRNQGVVFQSYALFPHMTVRKNLEFPLSARGIRGAQATTMVDRVLDTTRISQFAHRYPSQLSGGQQQRVALARALVFNPPLLLMDESLSALDRNLREEMQLELKSLHTELSTTIVFVTHDQGEALTMSDRVAVLKDGRLIQFAEPELLYRKPTNRFVAQFMGDANFLDVTLGDVFAECANGKTASGYSLAGASGSVSTGKRAMAMVRPEAIDISLRNNTDDRNLNVLSGTVTRAIFSGSSHRYWVTLDSGESIGVRTPNTSSIPKFEVDSEVTLRFSASDVIFLQE